MIHQIFRRGITGLAIVVCGLGLGLQSASATPIYNATASISLGIAEFLDGGGVGIVQPGGVSITAFTTVDPAPTVFIVGDAIAGNTGGPLVTAATMGLGGAGFIDQASTGQVDTPAGFAASAHNNTFTLELSNSTAELVVVNFLLDWAILASATVDDILTETATALANVLIVDAAGASLLDESVEMLAENSDSSVFTVFLAADSVEIFTISALTTGTAESTVSVPAPGTLLLMGLGLSLIGLRNRKLNAKV